MTTATPAQTEMAKEPPRSRIADFGRLRAMSVLAFGATALLIEAFSWRDVGLQPSPGTDPSWSAGLEMAVHLGIPFGSNLIFTYGPLGFLDTNTIWYPTQGLASFLWGFFVRFALVCALYMGARRSFGRILGFAIAVIVMSVVNDSSAGEPIIAVIVAIYVLGTAQTRSARFVRFVVIGMAALSGLEMLTKVSIGLCVTSLTAVMVLSLPRERAKLAAIGAGAWCLGLIVSWIVAGQDIGALPSYLRYAADITSGYSAAMNAEVPGLGWQLTAALAGLAVGAWAAWLSTDGFPLRQRAGAIALWGVFWFFGFKEAFVRHDPWHAASLFSAMLGGLLAFKLRRPHRPPALLLGACMLSILLAAQGVPFSTPVAPLGNLSDMIAQVKDVSSGSHRDVYAKRGRAAVQTAFPLPQAARNLIGRKTVAIFPNELTIAWAYGLHWDPLPVLQSYSAYTSALDRLDARFLESRAAPQTILFKQDPDMDGRLLQFDQPEALRVMLCHYRADYATAPFAVLTRVPNRCSTPTLIDTVLATWNQSVRVPPAPDANSIVFVRVSGADVGGLEVIRSLLYKPHNRSVSINGYGYRLIAATVSDGLPMTVPKQLDYPFPFKVGTGASTISIGKDGQAPTTDKPLTFAFYEEKVAAPA